MSHIFDSVMALCACGTRFWPRGKDDTKCYGCQAEERSAAPPRDLDNEELKP